MQKITAVIITYNEEENIKECLESVRWTDEIVIVDSHSKDGTLDTAKQYTDKIILTDNISYGEKRNLGIKEASNDWILWLDADERVSNDLKNEIKGSLNNSLGDITGFMLKRRTFFINKFINHCGWYPDYSLRLFRKSKGILFTNARVHEKLMYTGKTYKLKTPLLHYTDLTFEHYVDKLNNYTSYAAMDLKESDKKAGIIDIIFRPVLTFLKMYFLKLGVLDGYTGLVLCTLSSVSVFTKYSKLYFIKS